MSLSVMGLVLPAARNGAQALRSSTIWPPQSMVGWEQANDGGWRLLASGGCRGHLAICWPLRGGATVGRAKHIALSSTSPLDALQEHVLSCSCKKECGMPQHLNHVSAKGYD